MIPRAGPRTTRVGMAHGIVAALCECDVTHVIYVADSGPHALRTAVEREPRLTLVPVCREGEALGVAAGLMVGGKIPVVVHQSTGFFESGDSIRGFALDFRLPVLLLIDCRGWQAGRPATDSAAVFIEPILRAWGIRYHVLEPGGDLAVIPRGAAEAREHQRPVAVLLLRDDPRP